MKDISKREDFVKTNLNKFKFHIR